jgi:hypothetical protein
MKVLTAIVFLAIILSPSYSDAQMGHGMMRGGDHMMGSQGIMEQQERRDDEQMTQHGHMMNNMMGMTQDMAIMMRQMSVIMGNITDPESSMSQDRINRMSVLMKDMSAEMDRISGLMQKGEVSQDEMRDMQRSLIKLQERMWELKK